MSLADPSVVARLKDLVREPDAADELLVGWLRRFTATSDRGLRRTVLTECLDELDDGSLLGVLHRLGARAAGGDADCRWLVTELALAPSIVSHLAYERTAELYAAAREAGEPLLAQYFLDGQASPEPLRGAPNPHLDASAGARTAAARGRDRLVLDRLLHDRDPRVIAALLDNPRLIERDVIRIAAMRPTAPEALERLAAHPRWGQRYRVRKALAFNPSAPIALARRLLPTLLRQHLLELADSRALPRALRLDVQALLGRDPPGR